MRQAVNLNYAGSNPALSVYRPLAQMEEQDNGIISISRRFKTNVEIITIKYLGFWFKSKRVCHSNSDGELLIKNKYKNKYNIPFHGNIV